MKLPVNVRFHPEDETPLSFASRLARAMAFPSVASLLGESTVRAVVRGDEGALRLISEWSGVPTGHLRRFAVPTSKLAGEWKLGDAVFRKEMRVAGRFRFCPHCIADDLENGVGRPESRPYQRASWLTQAVTACTRHNIVLCEMGNGAPTSDVARFVAEGLHRKHLSTTRSQDGELEVDAYIQSRIAGNRTASFIDRQEVHVLLVLFEFLGSLVQKHLPSLSIQGKGVRACGFTFAKEGESTITSLVREAIRLHRPAPKSISTFFGPSVRCFTRNAHVPAYAEVIAILHEAVGRSAAVGPGDSFIEPFRSRHLHSIQSASIEYGLSEERVRKLLERHSVITQSNVSPHRVWFSAEDAMPVLEAARNYMNTVEVAATLGTNIQRIGSFIRRGLLKSVTMTADGVRPYFQVSPDDLDDFRRRLFEKSEKVVGDHGLVPLNVACQRKSLTQTDVIEMIFRGNLINVGRRDEARTLGSLLVDLDELPNSDKRRSMNEGGEGQSPYLSFAETERALSTTTATVRALVANGVLPTEQTTNPRTRRSQRVVHRKSISTFLATYRSLHQIARGWQRSIVVTKQELDRVGLNPVFKSHGKIASYYRIQELSDSGMLPPDA